MKDLISAEQSNPKGITPRCLICGEGLGGNRSSCSSCDTPTHPECREWAQGCPLYGCREMSHASLEELSDVAPQEQHEAYQSLLGRMWHALNTPIGELFTSKERALQKNSPYFGIAYHGDFYRIRGALYRGSLCTFDVMNYATKNNGVQVGLINVAKEGSGHMLGIVNLLPDKPWYLAEVGYSRCRPSMPEEKTLLRLEEKLASDQGPRCTVCSGAAMHTFLTCPACATRVHTECWDYYGGCGIYGCDKNPIEPVKPSFREHVSGWYSLQKERIASLWQKTKEPFGW